MQMRAAIALVLFLAGCAAQAASTGPSLDLNALVRVHPLYGALAQYDRQISVLRATLHVREFAQKDAAFANAQQAVRANLDAAAARSRHIAAMPSPNASTLNASATIQAPSEGTVRGDVQRAYQAQAAELRSRARQDLAHYRTALLTQQNAAFANYVRGVQARVRQAYDSRAQELYEKTSTLALDLAKADANKRLPLRTKLQTLHLDPARSARIHAQLAAIQAHEDAIVNAQRRKDRETLAAFLPPLEQRAASDVARTRVDLQNRTAANLAARQRVYDAQMASSSRLRFGASAPPPSAPATSMRAQLDTLLSTRPADPAAFTQAGADLSKHFTTLRENDTAATRSTLNEIATLQTDREQLYDEIVSQINRDADRVQREHPGANVTQAVRADLAALSH
ncbi:MAG TPA: hypothetical protein VKT72_08965 [Candidatus Baltobacteraceae bacterium]|nr:hypothetical protein [Candidatus Baltobacteraceae bacterium]